MYMDIFQKEDSFFRVTERTENDMSNSTTLRIQDPPQYDVTIETDFQQSIFLDMYRGAARNVDAIIERNKTVGSSSCELANPDASINTTIAFVGGRGTGKSSAMQSFSNYLQTGPKTGDGVWQGCTDALPKFVALPTIDSSQISEHETVIGRMSAAMLAGFRKGQKSLSLEKRQEFLGCAKEINELAVLLQTGEWFKCGDKLLTNTERICGMKASVRKLVDSYLSIVCKENAYLIITIDDLDMGIQSAYAIMEEIRQYLSIPRVVVLVSIDETLLDAVVRASINESMNVSNPDKEHKALVKDLSYRYLEKLFPVNRRHHTPRLTANQLREWKSEGFIDDATLNVVFNGEPPTVRNAILHLIWRKTMLIPVCNRDDDHLLIPRNLRSLCHMVVLLRSMPDIAYEDKNENREDIQEPRIHMFEDFRTIRTENNDTVDQSKEKTRHNLNADRLRETLRHNLNVFGKYIVDNLSSYGAPQLSTENEADMAKVLETVIHQMQEIPLSRMNAMIVGDILYHVGQIAKKHDTYKQILGKVARSEKGEDEHCDMLSPAIRYQDSISLGDVVYVLGMLDSRSKCTYVRYLVEVIRILWSIRMTEELYVNGTAKDAQTEKVDFFTTKEFRYAVGGSFVNPDHVTEFVDNCGWKKYDEIYTYSADFSKFLILYRGAIDPQAEAWRDTRSDGGPYYTVENPNVKSGIWCNPFAVYNRLLTEKGEFQQKYIMALPFYSFDFMYRYYEELHEKFRAQKDRCFFWQTLTILLKGEDVVKRVVEVKFLPQKKSDELEKSFSDANTYLDFDKIFKDNSEKWKKDAAEKLGELIKRLQNLQEDQSEKLETILKRLGDDNDTAKAVRDAEESAKKKICDLFALINNGYLALEINWRGDKPSEVYKGYDMAESLKDKIDAATEISKLLSDSVPVPASAPDPVAASDAAPALDPVAASDAALDSAPAPNASLGPAE